MEKYLFYFGTCNLLVIFQSIGLFFDEIIPFAKELLGADDKGISHSYKFLFFSLARLVGGDLHSEKDIRKIKGNLSKSYSQTLEDVLQLRESSALLDTKSKVFLLPKLSNLLSTTEYHTWWNSRTYRTSKELYLLLELIIHLKHLKRLCL
ncbi:hypothetical protein M9H77_31024 [Catharanthus roseus]|uniref:Uncharacterized protein n=1 Tax=Catharanthus roseus TaxID=4058 RepID=A0ACC0A1J9_CATRO|nr:hypothetical protein M9H77_31024 [Catharanthus roseus]